MTPRAFLCAATCLSLACAARQKPPEPIAGWMARSTTAWTALKDQGQSVPALDRLFAQTGMSTATTVVFVVLPSAAKEPWAIQAVEAIGKGPVAAAGYQVTQRPVGDAVRVEIGGLSPNQRYRVTLASGEVLESQTAPEHTGPTSVLLISCNEPWNSATEDGSTVGVPLASASALRLLDLRATGQLPVELSRQDGKVSFERPGFLLGLGDQAYVDAEPGKQGTLALFAGARSADLRVAVTAASDWAGILDRIYRMHFLIPTVHRALSAIPSAMVWDDHEIRDGWGSQRDEDAVLPLTQRPWLEYFAAARLKTWEFEVARNPNAGGQAVTAFDPSLDRELDTSFGWGDRLKVFLLDTRTTRGRPEGSVMSAAQLVRVQDWLGPCGTQPSAFLLGVPVPMSVNHDNAITAAGAALQSEFDDDVLDGWWSSDPARTLRMQLETAIAEHASRCPNDRIVLVSGDVHESGLVAVSKDDRTIAYEVISSGIASMVFNGALSKAFVATRGGYHVTSPNGVSYSGVGRISIGSSFAELFFDFPPNSPPRIRTLFYPTTRVDVIGDNTLVNVGESLKGKSWQTGTTGTAQLGLGQKLVPEAAAIELDYGIKPPPGEFPVSRVSMRCTTDKGALSFGTPIDELATDWSTLLPTAPECRIR